MVAVSNLSWQGIKRQCTLKGQARYVNVRDSVPGRECTGWGIETWGCKIFFIGF